MKFRASWCVWMMFLVACAMIAGTPVMRAQDHVVSTQDLHKDVQKAAQTRQADEAAVRQLFSSDVGQKALKSARLDYQKVEKAIGQLSDEELAKLAERSRKVEKDFAAGKLSDRDLIIIVVIGLLVILLVVALR